MRQAWKSEKDVPFQSFSPKLGCGTSEAHVMVGYILFLFPYVCPTVSVKFNNSKCCDRYYVCRDLMESVTFNLPKKKKTEL